METGPISFSSLLASKQHNRRTLHYVVLRMLMQYAFTAQKRIHPVEDSDEDQRDGVAPDGMAELPGPTSVFIHIGYQATSKPDLTRDLQRMAYWSQNKSQSSVVVVWAVPTRRTSDELTTIAREVFQQPVRVFGPDMLDNIVRENEKFARDLLENAESLAVADAVSGHSQTGDWKAQRDERLEQVRRAFKDRGLVLVLGAGISKSVNLPDWPTLLAGLLTEAIGTVLESRIPTTASQRDSLAEIFKQQLTNSPLIDAHYLRVALSSGFPEAVRRQLYRESSSASSPLLESLARLCAPRRNVEGVQLAVTYNFDDVLERALTSANIDHQSLYRDSELNEPDVLGIYHVHGFVPHDDQTWAQSSDAPLVFSE